jgi:hypothetical protein
MADQQQIWGYIPDFDLEAAFASAEANRDLLTGVTQVRYHLNSDGELVPYAGARPAPAWLRSRGRAPGHRAGLRVPGTAIAGRLLDVR